MDEAERLLKKLKNPNPVARINAIITLAGMGDERALPAFAKNRLIHKDKTLKVIGAVKELAELHPNSPYLADVADTMADLWLEIERKIVHEKNRTKYNRPVESVFPASDPEWMEDIAFGCQSCLGELGPVAVPVLLGIIPKIAWPINESRIDVKVAIAIAHSGPKATDALLEALYHGNLRYKHFVNELLLVIIRNLNTDGQVSEFERKLNGNMAERKADNDTQICIAKLQSKIAHKKNALADKRSIMLEGTPKAPKRRGGMWQATRRMTF